jgi:amino acid adenylation domain-containing protein
VALPVTTLFEHPTVAQFARRASGILAGGRMAARKLERAPRDAQPSLSFAQERFWFLRQLAQGGPSFNLSAAIRIEGPLDVEALRRSIEEVVRRHEVLRTTYRSVDGRPTLLVQPPATLALPLVELSELAPADVETHVGRLVDEEAHRSLSLEEAPLIRTKLVRLGPTEHLLLWTADHIAWDGQSTVVAALEVAALYPALRDGRPSPLAEPSFQYADYAASQRQWLSEDYLREQVAFWRAELAGAPDTLDLPFERPRPPVQSHRGASVSFELDAKTVSALRDLGRASGATLYMALLAGFNALVSRYTGQTDIVVGTPIANRGDPELEALVGPLINGLPLRTRIAGDPTFVDLMASVRRTCLSAYAHQDTPVERLVQELVEHRDLSRSPLFQLVFALHSELPPLELDGLRLTLLDDLGKTFYAEADLAINLWQAGDRVRGTCVFATDLFEPATVTRMMAHFRQLLDAAASSPNARISELVLLPQDELQRTLIEWNRSRVVWDQPADLLHQAMERHADVNPSAIAVVSEGRSWTYGDLETRANQLAAHLRELGAGPDVPVALCVERSFEMVVGILGISKAGAAYVPLDPAYRKERLAFMLTDARAPVLLTQARLVAGLPDHTATVVCLDRDWPTISERSSARADCRATADNLAYVIYTSGSTGTPKGIAIRHRGVLNNIIDLNRRFDVGAGDSVLSLSSLSFDMCVYEVLGMLEAGATVIMPDASAARDPAHWAELIRRHRVTIWNSAPALLGMLLDHVERGGAAKPVQSLRLALLGGDWVPVSAPDRLRAAAPDVRVIVMGGATEASIHSIIYEVEAVDPGWISIPYGRPMANQTAYVLDPGLQPAPVGVPGELFLGGVGLARGYFARPDLTADRFVPHPFPSEPGMRLYRTGDLARYRADGTIELIGRVDFQVKIRGVRIELGEIVSVLREHPAVRDAVVVASDHDPRERKLVAYVVWQPGSNASQVELRRYLKDRLPEYMVPSVVTVLEKLPLSPNGKIDRRALPPPSTSTRDLDEPFVEPRTDLERVVGRMCCEVLDVDGVGVNDSFFDLGGNSLLAIRLQAQIRDVFELEAPLRLLFGAPTVARLAEALAAMAADEGIDLERVAGIVLSVDAMSDEEALAQVSGVLGDARVEEAG